MSLHLSEIHANRVAQLSNELRQQGFVVEREPAQLGDTRFPFRPDLVACGTSKTRVIEVLGHFEEEKRKLLAEMSQVVNGIPEATFEMIFLDETVAVPDDAQEMTLVDSARRLEEAEDLLKLNHPQSAELLAWTAIEAALRNALSNVDDRARRRGLVELIKTGDSFGIISEESARTLYDLLPRRNAQVHGYHFAGASAEETRKNLDFAKAVLSEIDENVADCLQATAI